jgi:hypothetical protein
MLRGVAHFADVGLQYIGVAEDNQTGKTRNRRFVKNETAIAEGREPVMF